MATYPGQHPTVDLEGAGFPVPERQIVYRLADTCFYITTCGSITIGNSSYRYVSARPSDDIAFALPNTIEFIILFSSYKNFEIRTLESFKQIEHKFDGLRINTHFKFLVSNDSNIELKIQKILSENFDLPVIVPFNFDDLLSGNATEKVLNTVRKSFYFRDLFAQRDPLREATFFFGRSELLSRLRDRMARCENSGFFGLRKSGKTSVLLAAERFAKADNHLYVGVDCQSSAVTTLRWNNLLELISRNLRISANMPATPVQLGDFSPTKAAESFERNLKEVSGTSKKIIVLSFDEIEQISPETGVGHWRLESDPLLFWQTVRSLHQKISRKFSFIITGTNPNILESRQLIHVDNPLLAYVDADYLGGLSESECEEMCKTLGNLMGMEFSTTAIAELYKALGGHAFLTRQVCSSLHKTKDVTARPIEVIGDDSVEAISSYDFSPLLDDILSSLRERFPDEYIMLEWVALDDFEEVDYFYQKDSTLVKHLIGYGLVDQVSSSIKPRMRIVTDYLRRSAKQSGLVKAPSDRWALIAKRRGELEVELRRLIRNRLIDEHGKAGAAEKLINCLGQRRGSELHGLSIDAIFSSTNGRLYWTDIIAVIKMDENYWTKRLDISKTKLLSIMDFVNKYRADAHANDIGDDLFDQLMGYIDSLKEAI